MSAIAFDGADCTGHGCYPPRENLTASSNVSANGNGIIRMGDLWGVHCCKDSCHLGAVVTGCSNVYVNGRPAARIGDVISCGSLIASGSSNVWAGTGGRSGSLWGIDSMLMEWVDFGSVAEVLSGVPSSPGGAAPNLGGLVLSGAGF